MEHGEKKLFYRVFVSLCRNKNQEVRCGSVFNGVFLQFLESLLRAQMATHAYSRQLDTNRNTDNTKNTFLMRIEIQPNVSCLLCRRFV